MPMSGHSHNQCVHLHMLAIPALTLNLGCWEGIYFMLFPQIRLTARTNSQVTYSIHLRKGIKSGLHCAMIQITHGTKLPTAEETQIKPGTQSWHTHH